MTISDSLDQYADIAVYAFQVTMRGILFATTYGKKNNRYYYFCVGHDNK